MARHARPGVERRGESVEQSVRQRGQQAVSCHCIRGAVAPGAMVTDTASPRWQFGVRMWVEFAVELQVSNRICFSLKGWHGQA
jgi:hypothetical protein